MAGLRKPCTGFDSPATATAHHHHHHQSNRAGNPAAGLKLLAEPLQARPGPFGRALPVPEPPPHERGAGHRPTDVHPKAVQTRMGHSSINVTFDRYRYLLPELEEASPPASAIASRPSARPRRTAPGGPRQLHRRPPKRDGRRANPA